MAAKKFEVFRVQKLRSKRAVTGAIMHNLRALDTHNADPDLLVKNLVPEPYNTVAKCKEKYNKALGDQKVRKGGIYGFEIVVTGSPERLKAMTKTERNKYFSDAANWAIERYGGSDNLVNMVVHNDEKTPHLQMVFIPNYNNKLNYTKYLGGASNRLSLEQSAFHNDVGSKHGFDRGKKRSKARHKAIKDYYREVEQLPEVKAENERLRAENARLNASIKEKSHKLKGLITRFEDTQNVIENRLRESLKSLILSLADFVKQQTPGQIQKVKDALSDVEEIKKELPDLTVQDIEEVTRSFKP